MEQFFHSGVLRIGSLVDFRNTAKYGENIGDQREGFSVVRQIAKDVRSVERGSFLSEIMSIEEGGVIHNLDVRITYEAWDCYAFCASYEFTEEGFKEWFEREQFDACYEIFDTLGLRQEISRGIFENARFQNDSRILYLDGEIDGESERRGIHPGYIKKTELEWQTEYRWLWRTRRNKSMLPELFPVIEHPRKFCRPFAMLENGIIKYA